MPTHPLLGQSLPVGFSTFKVAKRAARVGMNPQTKAKMKIPARKAVTLVAGKAPKQSV